MNYLEYTHVVDFVDGAKLYGWVDSVSPAFAWLKPARAQSRDDYLAWVTTWKMALRWVQTARAFTRVRPDFESIDDSPGYKKVLDQRKVKRNCLRNRLLPALYADLDQALSAVDSADKLPEYHCRRYPCYFQVPNNLITLRRVSYVKDGREWKDLDAVEQALYAARREMRKLNSWPVMRYNFRTLQMEPRPRA